MKTSEELRAMIDCVRQRLGTRRACSTLQTFGSDPCAAEAEALQGATEALAEAVAVRDAAQAVVDAAELVFQSAFQVYIDCMNGQPQGGGDDPPPENP
jgi:hypothetical protein